MNLGFIRKEFSFAECFFLIFIERFQARGLSCFRFLVKVRSYISPCSGVLQLDVFTTQRPSCSPFSSSGATPIDHLIRTTHDSTPSARASWYFSCGSKLFPRGFLPIKHEHSILYSSKEKGDDNR